MPYLIISVYQKNYGELLKPYIFQIGNKTKTYKLNENYIKFIEDIKNDLMDGYIGSDFDDIYQIEEYIVKKISRL